MNILTDSSAIQLRVVHTGATIDFVRLCLFDGKTENKQIFQYYCSLQPPSALALIAFSIIHFFLCLSLSLHLPPGNFEAYLQNWT